MDEAEKRRKERARQEREAATARCAVCGESVGVEDRCADGTYLHLGCAQKTSTR